VASAGMPALSSPCHVNLIPIDTAPKIAFNNTVVHKNTGKGVYYGVLKKTLTTKTNTGKPIL